MSYFSDGPEGKNTEYCEPHDEVKTNCATCLRAELNTLKDGLEQRSKIVRQEAFKEAIGLMFMLRNEYYDGENEQFKRFMVEFEKILFGKMINDEK